MVSLRWSVLALLALPMGCHGPGYNPYGYSSPYGTYGGQPYMQPYGTPVQTLTPGPSYVPGTYPPGSIPPGGSTIPGGGLSPTPDPYRGTPAPAGGTFAPSGGSTRLEPVGEPNGGAAPMYSPPAGGGNINVPFPSEPSASFQPPVQRNMVAEAPFSAPAPAAAPMPLGADLGDNPFAGRPLKPISPVSPAAAAAVAEEMLNESTQPIKLEKPVIPVSGEVRPFAYDAEGYKWMRGIISYEKSSKCWSLVYSDAPDATDEFAGCVTIADHPDLVSLKDGDVVSISGEFAGAQADYRGKPVYIIDKVERVTPAAVVPAN